MAEPLWLSDSQHYEKHSACDGSGKIDCRSCRGTGQGPYGGRCGSCMGELRTDCPGCGGNGSQRRRTPLPKPPPIPGGGRPKPPQLDYGNVEALRLEFERGQRELVSWIEACSLWAHTPRATDLALRARSLAIESPETVHRAEELATELARSAGPYVAEIAIEVMIERARGLKALAELYAMGGQPGAG